MAGKKESSAKIDDRKSSSVPEKFKPIPYVEMTNRSCNLESLARVQDERFCNKYYVCSADRYVSLFCPTGMAFDYSQQNCRLQTVVDCSQRQLIAIDVGEIVSESSVHSKVIEPFEAASISMTLAPIPASAVTTLPPITAAASTPAPVSTPITVVTSTSRNSSGMKLSRGRKVHSKDEQVIGQPLRSRNRNLQANQDRSENKFVREGEGNLDRDKNVSDGTSAGRHRHRFNLARAKAVKAAKVVGDQIAVDIVAPLSRDDDGSVTATSTPNEDEDDEGTSEESEHDSVEEQALPAAVNPTSN